MSSETKERKETKQPWPIPMPTTTLELERCVGNIRFVDHRLGNIANYLAKRMDATRTVLEFLTTTDLAQLAVAMPPQQRTSQLVVYDPSQERKLSLTQKIAQPMLSLLGFNATKVVRQTKFTDLACFMQSMSRFSVVHSDPNGYMMTSQTRDANVKAVNVMADRIRHLHLENATEVLVRANELKNVTSVVWLDRCYVFRFWERDVWLAWIKLFRMKLTRLRVHKNFWIPEEVDQVLRGTLSSGQYFPSDSEVTFVVHRRHDVAKWTGNPSTMGFDTLSDDGRLVE